MTDRLLTARELGEILGLAPGTVLDHWQAGRLPGYKVGRAVRFDLEEILTLTRRDANQVSTAARQAPAALGPGG